MGHPWETECVVLIRKHPNLYADTSALHYRPWRHYQAFITALEYGVEHKLIFGSDFPSATPEQAIAGLLEGERHRRGDAVPEVPRRGDPAHHLRELEAVPRPRLNWPESRRGSSHGLSTSPASPRSSSSRRPPSRPTASTVLPEVLSAFARSLYDAGIRVFLPGAGHRRVPLPDRDRGRRVRRRPSARRSATTRSSSRRSAWACPTPWRSGGARIEAGPTPCWSCRRSIPTSATPGLRDYFQALMKAIPVPFLAYKKGPFPSDELLGELGRRAGSSGSSTR